ncbi:RRP15-like protein, partial [Euroglyphus maynei]
QSVRTWISKPCEEDAEKEKNLTLIATKGVVQLFNVVREKQRILKRKLEEAGSSESKRTKILTEFSEKEMQDERIKASSKKPISKKNHGSRKKWPVLADDFMTGAKFKDWNEESDND